MTTGTINRTARHVLRNDTTAVATEELQKFARGVSIVGLQNVRKQTRIADDSLARYTRVLRGSGKVICFRLPTLRVSAEEGASQSIRESVSRYEYQVTSNALAACMDILKAREYDTARSIDWVQDIQIFSDSRQSEQEIRAAQGEFGDRFPEFVWDKSYYKALRKAEKFSE